MIVNLMRSAESRAALRPVAHDFYKAALEYTAISYDGKLPSEEVRRQLIEDLTDTFVGVEWWRANNPGEDMGFREDFATTIGVEGVDTSIKCEVDGLNLAVYDMDTLVERLKSEGPAGIALLETPDPMSEDGLSFGESALRRMSDLRNIEFGNVRFTNCDFSRTHIFDCTLHNANIMYTDVFKNGDLLKYSPVSFDNCSIECSPMVSQEVGVGNRQYDGSAGLFDDDGTIVYENIIFGDEKTDVWLNNSIKGKPVVFRNVDIPKSLDVSHAADVEFIGVTGDISVDDCDSVTFKNCNTGDISISNCKHVTFIDCNAYGVSLGDCDSLTFKDCNGVSVHNHGLVPCITFDGCSDSSLTNDNLATRSWSRLKELRINNSNLRHVGLDDFSIGRIEVDSSKLNDVELWGYDDEEVVEGAPDIREVYITDSEIACNTFEYSAYGLRGGALPIRDVLEVRNSSISGLRSKFLFYDTLNVDLSNVNTPDNQAFWNWAKTGSKNDPCTATVFVDGVDDDVMTVLKKFAYRTKTPFNGALLTESPDEQKDAPTVSASEPMASPDSPGAKVSGIFDAVKKYFGFER